MNLLKSFSSNTARHLTRSVWQTIYSKEMRRQMNPVQAQEKALEKIRKNLAHTVLAKDLRLDDLQSYDSYVRNLPPRDYEFYRPYVDRIASGEQGVLFEDICEAFVQTSGTTGYLNKHIPYNEDMVRAAKRYQYKAAAIMALNCKNADPLFDERFSYATVVRNTSKFVGKIPKANASELWSVAKKPIFGRRNQVLTAEILDAPTWEQKLNNISQASLNRDVRIVTGIPLYMVGIFEHLIKSNNLASLQQIWPNLEAFFYSGSGIAPYREKLDLLAGKRLNYFGGYLASEGLFGLPCGTTECMVFNVRDFLFSFRKVQGAFEQDSAADSRMLGISELDAGAEYEVFVGCPNGFLQFKVGDLIRIETIEPVVTFRVLGRTLSINVANEKTSQVKLDQALGRVKEKFSLKLPHYFVYPAGGQGAPESSSNSLPHYQWDLVVDPHAPTVTGQTVQMVQDQLAESLDAVLNELAPDYRDCRVLDGLIGPAQVRLLPPQLIDELFEMNQNKGQFKMKSVFRTQEEFLSFVRPAAERVGYQQL